MVYDMLDPWESGSVVRSGRRHGIGNAHILAAMTNAGRGQVVEARDGTQLHFIGVDDRGVELHVVAVADNHRDGGLAVIHAMPTRFANREGSGP